MFSDFPLSAAPFSGTGFSSGALVSVTGVQGDTQLGTVAFSFGRTVFPTGVQATSQTGTVTLSLGCTVFPTGVRANAFVGRVLVWSEIDIDDIPNWQVIPPPSAGAWTPVQTLGLN